LGTTRFSDGSGFVRDSICGRRRGGIAAPPTAATPATPAPAATPPAAIPAPPAIAPPSTTVPTPGTPIRSSRRPHRARREPRGRASLPSLTPSPPHHGRRGPSGLPAYAYPSPQTRGLPFSSLWLTFHGLQWPYMPALNKDQRFVVGLSGFGWLDTAVPEVRALGDGSVHAECGPDQVPEGAGPLPAPYHPDLAFRDGIFVQGHGRAGRTLDQTSQRQKPRRRGHRRSVHCASASGIPWVFRWVVSRAGRCFHLGMAWTRYTFERQGRASAPACRASRSPFMASPTTSSVSSGPAATPHPLLPAPLPPLRAAGSSERSTRTTCTRPVRSASSISLVKLKAGVEYQRQSGQRSTTRPTSSRKGVGGRRPVRLLAPRRVWAQRRARNGGEH
jgi:hypothetical protein